MKIASSTIAMQSERTYTAIRQEVREEKTQYITENDDKAENVKQPSIADAVKGMIEKQAELYGTANQGKVEPSYESEFSLKVKLMEKMLEALSKMVKGTGRKNPISLYDLFDNGNKSEIINLGNRPAPGKWVKNIKNIYIFCRSRTYYIFNSRHC